MNDISFMDSTVPLKNNDSNFESAVSHFFESVGMVELMKLVLLVAIYHYVAQTNLNYMPRKLRYFASFCQTICGIIFNISLFLVLFNKNTLHIFSRNKRKFSFSSRYFAALLLIYLL